MKKSLFGMFAVAMGIAAALFTGCNKNSGGESGETGIAGRYLMSSKPFSCEMTAADESAKAFSMEGVIELTFGDLITAAKSTIESAEVDPVYVTFNNDGTIDAEPQVNDGTEDIPDYTADQISYSVNKNNFTLKMDADLIFSELEIPAETVAQIKPMLKVFDKGLLVYSDSDSKFIVNLRYSLSGGQLKIFADKALVNDTWTCADSVLDMVILMLEAQDPATAAMLTSVSEQVPGIINGLTKIEIGMTMSEQ